MNEQHRWIKGWEGIYTINKQGEVKSYHKPFPTTIRPRWNESRNRWDVRLVKDNYSINRDLHQLVAEAFLPNPNGCTALIFRDGDVNNYSLPNLSWKAEVKDLSLPPLCIWVKGFEGRYFIDPNGCVCNSKGSTISPRNRNGYLTYSLYKNNKRYTITQKQVLSSLNS